MRKSDVERLGHVGVCVGECTFDLLELDLSGLFSHHGVTELRSVLCLLYKWNHYAADFIPLSCGTKVKVHLMVH